MTIATTPAAPESKVRRVWKSAQMYLTFHKDQSKRERKEPKFWPPKNGSASLHGDTAQQEAIVVIKAADPDQAKDETHVEADGSIFKWTGADQASRVRRSRTAGATASDRNIC